MTPYCWENCKARSTTVPNLSVRALLDIESLPVEVDEERSGVSGHSRGKINPMDRVRAGCRVGRLPPSKDWKTRKVKHETNFWQAFYLFTQKL